MLERGGTTMKTTATTTMTPSSPSPDPTPPPRDLEENQNKDLTTTTTTALSLMQGKEWWQQPDMVTKIWQGIAIGCIVVNLLALVIEGSTISMLAGLIAIVLAALVFYYQMILQKEGSLRTIQNELRNQVNRFSLQNQELTLNNNKLANQVDRMKDHESQLESLTKEQGTNVETFVHLVKTNRTTLNALKTCVHAGLKQTFLSAILQSDFDQSASFSDQEIQMLQLRLESIPGATINKEMLARKINETNRQVWAIVDLLKELDLPDIPNDQRIFLVKNDT